MTDPRDVIPSSGERAVSHATPPGTVQATQGDLLDLWRLAGGTIIPGHSGEAGYMRTPKLLEFLRRMVEATRAASPVGLLVTGAELEAFREWKALEAAEKRERAAGLDVVDADVVEVVPALSDESRLKPAAAIAAPAAPAAAPASVAPYARALMTLLQAAAPGLEESDNILEDARRVAATFGPAELAGYFILEEVAEVGKVHTQVSEDDADAPDVFPLFRRAAVVKAPEPARQAEEDIKEHAATAAPAPVPAGRGKGRGAKS